MGALEELMTVRFSGGFNGRSQTDSRSERHRRVNTALPSQAEELPINSRPSCRGHFF